MPATSYSAFSLTEVVERFGLTVDIYSDLFALVQKQEPSESLKAYLAESALIAVASRSEKARSELIVVPILLEVRRLMANEISFYSGFEFNIAPQDGLSGVCDFLLSRNKNPLLFHAPVLAIVEAKREDVTMGYGQCVAQMVAAQRFNESENAAIPAVYGAVTTGEVWKFLRLQQHTAAIDSTTYYLGELPEVLGVLLNIVRTA